jgi:hypothetical protein
MEMNLTIHNKKKRLGPDTPLKPFIKPISYHYWKIEGENVPIDIVIFLGASSFFIDGYLNWKVTDIDSATEAFRHLFEKYKLPIGYTFVMGNFESDPNTVIRIGTVLIYPTSEQIHIYILKL